MTEENFTSGRNDQNLTKINILKNVVLISLAFMMQFVAGSGISNLQSSINSEAGLGTASLAAAYAGLIISNLFLPVLVIKWLGTKWTMALCLLTYMPYIGAQLMPSFYVMIPAGLFGGLGGGPLWCAQSTYLSMVSQAHSKISKINAEVLLPRFMGIFYMIYQTNEIWGNLISSLVLSSGDNAAAVTTLNTTQILEVCGANFLPVADAEQVLQPQPQEKILIIAGIYMACMAGAALIVAVGVDTMTRYESNRPSESSVTGVSLLSVTVKLLLEPNLLLLLIITIFSGYQYAFFSADVTAAFASCAIGTGAVGYVMMTVGLAGAIGCVVTGYIVKVTGRAPLMAAAAVIHCALFATLLMWRPHPDLGYVLYIIAACWGLVDSVWNVQIISFYGNIFRGREEAAYSNFRLWASVGQIIAYTSSPYLRISSKIWILITLLVVGFGGYVLVEMRQRTKKYTDICSKETKEFGEKSCDYDAAQNISDQC